MTLPTVDVPKQEAEAFAAKLQTDQYKKTERDYKVAVHIVMSALLSEDNLGRDDLPDMIANVFSETIPNMDALGIGPEEQQFVKEAVADLGPGALKSAMANLGGGKWGLAQFIWIPRAVEYELGPQIADAFRNLIDPTDAVPSRVDGFRDQLYEASQALETKGGFQPNWTLSRVSLPFIATVLGGFDPSQFTFYSAQALRNAYEQYAPQASWPKGTAGQRYIELCEFVQSVAAALKSHGAAVVDLIDAQSFVWTSFLAAKELAPPPDEKKPGQEKTKAVDVKQIAKDLSETTYWPLERAENLISLVQKWGQVLFQGPPGTSKTFVAETVSRLLAGDEEGRVEVVQFHPSYAYEDFVEGIRPRVTEGSDLAYEVRRGIFMRLADRAKDYPEEPFFLIVDELNRANLPRVFGELLYALEYRGAEHPFRLPYSGAESYIPTNITLIATMNTADRSIALVDAAIRRRFRHVDFDPDPLVLGKWLADQGLAELVDDSVGRLEALNKPLLDRLDRDRLIGHTYLMQKDLADVGLAAVWNEDIEPILREHLFNQPDEIAKLRDIFLGQ